MVKYQTVNGTEGPFSLSVTDAAMLSRGDLIQIGSASCVVAKVFAGKSIRVKQLPRWKLFINRMCEKLDIPPFFREHTEGAIVVFKVPHRA